MSETQMQAAEKIFNAVKKTITAAKAANKKNSLASPDDYGWKRQYVYINIREKYSELKSGKRRHAGFAVHIEGKPVACFKSIADLEAAFRDFKGLVQEQGGRRGWDGLEYKDERISLYDGSRYDDNVSVVSLVILQPAPCKEYGALMAYINRHCPGTNLQNRELYSVFMEGKKGYLYSETGENDYLDSHPARCKRFLEAIRKSRSAKDKMTCRYGKETYMDPDEYESSCRDQIECSGEKRRFLRVVITSPSGRVKYDDKLF